MFRGGGSNTGYLRLERYPLSLDILVVSLIGTIFSDLLYSIALTIVSVRYSLLLIFSHLIKANVSRVPRLLNVYDLDISLLLVVIVLYFTKASLEESNVIELSVYNEASLDYYPPYFYSS